MSTQKVAAWSHAEEFVTPGAHVEEAVRHGEELGARPVGNGVGAALQLLAAATGAKAVMEIGTGAGASGLWLLGGMPADGILTTIDLETEHQRAARDAFAAAGFAHQRTRVIAGRALEVLPRMTDGAYDLVVVDADREEYPDYVEQAARLLRQRGHPRAHVVGQGGRPGQPRRRDPHPARGRPLDPRPRRLRHRAAAGRRGPARRRQALSPPARHRHASADPAGRHTAPDRGGIRPSTLRYAGWLGTRETAPDRVVGSRPGWIVGGFS